MAWSVQAGTGATAASLTSLSVPQPASVTAGDLLLLIVDSQNPATTFTASGYTSIYNDTSGADAFYVLAKTAGSSEPSATVTASGADNFCAIIVRVRGHGAAPAQLTANASSTTTASIDPPDTGALKVAIFHCDPIGPGAVTWTTATPAGDIELGNAASIRVGYKEEDTAGALAFTWAGAGSPGTLIMSLAPGAPAAPAFIPQIIIS